MSKRPTPETDAAWSCFKGHTELLHDVRNLSRKLERERDEAIAQAHNFEQGYHIHSARADEAIRERNELREALDRIARPVWWMQEDQKRKTGSINGICGGMALALSEDAEYLKGIAKSALKRGTK